MVVKVKTNFFGQPELEIENPTLRKILLELSNRTEFSIINPVSNRIHGEFKVYLNGVEQEDTSHGIDTVLKEGDKVEVTLIVLSGG
ncbi:MAG: hypothetical protein HXY44_02145 [Syntrophaceae bacterium]|nr:hypothetical protein [Syntrophaceae bacterium]